MRLLIEAVCTAANVPLPFSDDAGDAGASKQKGRTGERGRPFMGTSATRTAKCSQVTAQEVIHASDRAWKPDASDFAADCEWRRNGVSPTSSHRRDVRCTQDGDTGSTSGIVSFVTAGDNFALCLRMSHPIGQRWTLFNPKSVVQCFFAHCVVQTSHRLSGGRVLQFALETPRAFAQPDLRRRTCPYSRTHPSGVFVSALLSLGRLDRAQLRHLQKAHLQTPSRWRSLRKAARNMLVSLHQK